MDHLAAIRTVLRMVELARSSEAARQMGLPGARLLVAQLRERLGAPGLVASPSR